MKITVIGAGHAGTTISAELARKGHSVTLLKTSNKLHNEHFAEIQRTHRIFMEENGNVYDAEVTPSTDLADAIKGSHLLIIYIQTNYHEDLIRKLSEHIEDGQAVLIEPGYLSTCYFLKYCTKNVTIIEAESSPIDCRIVAPGHVKVLFRNVMNPVGVFPHKNKSYAASILNHLGFPFRFTDSVIEAALHNPNLIVHTIGAVFSIPRIEYVMKNGGTYSMYREVFTPHIWNLVTALDAEKIQVLRKLNCQATSYVEACKERNTLDKTQDAEAVFFDYAYNSSPDGPDTPNSRYVTEDIPQGLVLLESLGILLGVETPVCSALISCASALLGIDFRATGRTVDSLSRQSLHRIINEL